MKSSSPNHRVDQPRLTPERHAMEGSPEALIEELRIHQAELEMQAQALDASQHVAEQQARKYRHLLSEVPVAICRVNDRGQIVEANRAAGRMLENDPESLTGHLLYRFGADESARRRLLEGLHKAVREQQHAIHGLWVSNKGELVLTDVYLSRMPDTTGPDGELTVVLIDQTAHHREHLSLRQAHDELRLAHGVNQELALVADRSPVAITICDAQMRIRWVNPAFIRQTGYSLVEARHQNPEALLNPPEQIARAMHDLSRDLATDGSIDRRMVVRRRKDGSTYQAELSIVPHLDEHHRISRYIVLEQDITDRLKAEADHEALVLTEVRHAAKSEFLSRMSHNMRTPLNAVLGFSQLLLRSHDPALHDSHRCRVQLIHDAGQQLLTLVDQALQLIRVDHVAERMKTHAVPIGPLVREGALMLEERAESRHITLVIEGDEDALVMADEQPVREIVHNLLSNAIKYSPVNAEVRVRMARDEDARTVSLSVIDQGNGIAQDDQESIFQPFVRLDATRDMAPGHGIGLAISRQLARAMNGHLSVSSDVGHGSIFRLQLPMAERLPPTETDAPLDETPDVMTRLSRLPAMDVLYVEDNAMNRLLMQAALEEATELNLRLAESLREARLAVTERRPDVLLLDMNLPDGHGLDLLPQLAPQAPGARPIHVIAVSADALPEHVLAATRAGVADYLVKPLQMEQLCAALTKAADNFAPGSDL